MVCKMQRMLQHTPQLLGNVGICPDVFSSHRFYWPVATPNVHEAFHLPGAALPNEFGNQRKERKRKTTCEEHPALTTWSSKDSIRLHPLNIRHQSLLRLVVLAPFWICFMNLWHLFGYDS